MQFKVIHRALVLALAAPAAASAGVVQPAASAPSIAGLPSHPVAPAARARAEATARDGVPVAELAPGAPSRYTVKRGDTLWRISGMYLRSPWRWPDLWGMNMGAIRNPHWIFPGQVLVLTIVDGRAHLAVEGGGASGIPEVRLEPGVQSEPVPGAGIPPIDMALIAPFMTRPLVVDPAQEAAAPRIVAVRQGRTMLAPGERAFVRGNVADASRFEVYRPARPLHDPRTHELLGYAADYLGEVGLDSGPTGPDAVSTVDVISTEREMGIGDRLVAAPPTQAIDFSPQAPAGKVDGYVVAVADDHEMAGKNSVVAIDLGADAGLRPGDVLAVMDAPRTLVDHTAHGDPTIQLPAQRVGLAMVFRTFPRVAYAVVLEARAPFGVAAQVVNP